MCFSSESQCPSVPVIEGRLELTPYRLQIFDAAVQLFSRWVEYCAHPTTYVIRKKHARETNKPMKNILGEIGDGSENSRELQTLSHTQPFDIDFLEDQRRLSIKKIAWFGICNLMSTSCSQLIYFVSQYQFIIMQRKTDKMAYPFTLVRAGSSLDSSSSGLTLNDFFFTACIQNERT